MATETQTSDSSAAGSAAEPVVHILWMNGGLGCDGDSVALTAATQPSIEEIVLGALPGLPRVAVHWPLIDLGAALLKVPTGGWHRSGSGWCGRVVVLGSGARSSTGRSRRCWSGRGV